MDSSAVTTGTTSSNIIGVNLPLLATPIKATANNIGNIWNGPKLLYKSLKIKDDPNHKRKKNKKRKRFVDRIKDIDHNYVNDMRENSYLMSYGPGAIGF